MEKPKSTTSEDLDDVINLMKQASLDDRDAQDTFDISQGVEFQPPDATDMGQSLARELYDFYNFVAATEFCNLRHVSAVTCRMMPHVQYVYQSIAKRRFKCSRSLKGKDVATRT